VAATSRLGRSLVFDFHSCSVHLVPSAVTVNHTGDVGRETNPPPGPTLGRQAHIKKNPKPHTTTVSKSKVKRMCDDKL